MSTFSNSELGTKCIKLSFIVLLFCGSVFSEQQLRQVERRGERTPRQSWFYEWLFGPPVKEKEIKNFTTSTFVPIIFHQVTHKRPHGESHPTTSTSPNSSDYLDRAEIHLYQSPNLTIETTLPTKKVNNSFNAESNPIDSLFPKPKPRNSRSNEPPNDFRQIQITDIQHAIGTELNEDEMNSDPSQVNLQEELEAIDRLEKNLTQDSVRRRLKRETTSKFRQLSIPYGHDSGSSASSNNRINTLSKRQLLLSPAEQEMYAIRQQQEMATAMLLQQRQQLVNPYNNRYNNRYVDDYYDDDSSYEDSDEYYDHFNRNGLFLGGMRYGARIPPIHHPYGIGRRSLPDDPEVTSQPKQGRANAKRLKSVEGNSFLGPISKAGRWGTIEDYDLSSDFNKLTGRKGIASRVGVGYGLRESHKELDKAAASEEAMHLQSMEKGRSSLGVERQEAVNISTSSSPDTSNITTTSATATTDATTATSTTTAEGGSATETPTSDGTTHEETEPPSEEETTIYFLDPDPITTTTTIQPSSTEFEVQTTPNSSPTDPTNSNPTDQTTPNFNSTDQTTTNSNPSSSQATDAPATTSTTSNPTSKPRPSDPTTTKPHQANVPPYRQTLNCRCGMQSVRGHDIGDDTIFRTMVNPWLVAVRTKQKHLCSGSIINNKYILTSKSCVHGMKGLIATAGIGSGVPKNFSVTLVNEHSSRNIALLKIRPTIAPNFAMRPICLPIRYQDEERNSLRTGNLVTFKKNSVKGNSGLQLVQTEVPMLSSTKCTSSAGSETICPGPPGLKMGLKMGPPATMKCGGDPGGVLQIYHKGYSYEQIGVVSTTVGCRANKTPGVYTDIRRSVKWILYNTKDARYCRKPKVTPQDLINTKKIDVETDIKELEEEEEAEEEEGEDWLNDELVEEERLGSYN